MKARPLLSRVADSVYWMSRYMERAENVARFLDVNLHLMLDFPASVEQQWEPIVSVTGDVPLFEERYGRATRESVTEFLVFDPKNPNSIVSCLRAARENARSVRDTISSEMWQQLNHVYLTMQAERRDGRVLTSPHDMFREIRMGCHLFEGITECTMSHNEAWSFIQLGRMLERADKTSRLLDVKYFILLPDIEHVGSSVDDVQWTAVLKSVSGFEMYRKRHGRISPANIVEFLLLDGEFPRAVRYCVHAASNALQRITGSPGGTFANGAERRLSQLRAELDYTPAKDIMVSGLHEFLDVLQVRLNSVDDEIYERFFALRPLENLAASA